MARITVIWVLVLPPKDHRGVRTVRTVMDHLRYAVGAPKAGSQHCWEVFLVGCREVVAKVVNNHVRFDNLYLSRLRRITTNKLRTPSLRPTVSSRVLCALDQIRISCIHIV